MTLHISTVTTNKIIHNPILSLIGSNLNQQSHNFLTPILVRPIQTLLKSHPLLKRHKTLKSLKKWKKCSQIQPIKYKKFKYNHSKSNLLLETLKCSALISEAVSI